MSNTRETVAQYGGLFTVIGPDGKVWIVMHAPYAGPDQFYLWVIRRDSWRFGERVWYARTLTRALQVIAERVIQ